MRPVMTRALRHENTIPDCPHCGAQDMEAASVSLGSLFAAVLPGEADVRIDDFVTVDAGGYADPEKAAIIATCPHCARPVVLAIDGLSVKLVAARTDLDRRYLQERLSDARPDGGGHGA